MYLEGVGGEGWNVALKLEGPPCALQMASRSCRTTNTQHGNARTLACTLWPLALLEHLHSLDNTCAPWPLALSEHAGTGDIEFVDELPTALRDDVVSFMTRDTMKRSPVFGVLGSHERRDLCRRMQPYDLAIGAAWLLLLLRVCGRWAGRAERREVEDFFIYFFA